jgi:hypothetical protein
LFELSSLTTDFLPAELIAESASMALGGVAAGNLGAYLPLLLRHAHAQAGAPKQLYQLLKVTLIELPLACQCG